MAAHAAPNRIEKIPIRAAEAETESNPRSSAQKSRDRAHCNLPLSADIPEAHREARRHASAVPSSGTAILTTCLTPEALPSELLKIAPYAVIGFVPAIKKYQSAQYDRQQERCGANQPDFAFGISSRFARRIRGVFFVHLVFLLSAVSRHQRPISFLARRSASTMPETRPPQRTRILSQSSSSTSRSSPTKMTATPFLLLLRH